MAKKKSTAPVLRLDRRTQEKLARMAALASGDVVAMAPSETTGIRLAMLRRLRALAAQEVANG